MFDLLIWIIFGAIIGWIASIIMRTNAQQGALANIIIGIIGALIGGLISHSLGGEGVNGFNLASFLLSVGGAVLLLAVVKMFSHTSG
jgi:uncharacterized membrane protein YeaQ/YmgE (transglycosylase-associated protein family)